MPAEKPSPEELEAWANQILSSAGERKMVNFMEQPPLFRPFEPRGERFMHVPEFKSLYEPRDDGRKGSVTGNRKCGCGNPKASASSMCLMCVRAQARKKHEALLQHKQKSIAEHFERYAWVQWWLFEKTDFTPDFAPDLIDEIAEIEEAYGLTYQEIWKMAQANPFAERKPVFNVRWSRAEYMEEALTP